MTKKNEKIFIFSNEYKPKIMLANMEMYERNQSSQKFIFNFAHFVDVVHIYPTVTGQRQTLTIGRSVHFSL